MAFKFALLYSIVSAAFVSAANDWSKPCFTGECQYDLPSTTDGSSGTLKIWGPRELINDITPAAGWAIIDCHPDKLIQKIRLVCEEGSAEHCGRLTAGLKTVNKATVGRIVRLPESCGGNAFAVVQDAWVADDQDIPPHLLPRLVRRDGSLPTVQGLSLGVDFSSIQLPPGSDPIRFAVQGANYGGAAADLEKPADDGHNDDNALQKRGLKKWVKKAAKGLKKLNEWDIEKKKNLKNIDIDKSFNIFEKSVSCPSINADVRMDLNTKAHALVSVSVVASGTFAPPKIKDFAVVATVNADIDGEIDLRASVGGKLDSGKVPLLDKLDVPGIKFDGILKIGPTFEIYGQAEAGLDVAVDMKVGVNYKVEKATFVFPPDDDDDDEKSGLFNLGDTPLTLRAIPTATVNGHIAAHVIPRFNFGIHALFDNIKADVFFDLDASATMTLNIDASAGVEAKHERRSLDSTSSAPPSFLRSRLAARSPVAQDTSDGLLVNPVPMNPALPPGSTQQSDTSNGLLVNPVPSKPQTTSTPEPKPKHSSTTSLASPTSSSASTGGISAGGWTTTTAPLTVGGCFEVDVGFDVHAGAEGKFFHFFDAHTQTKLFAKHWSLVKKCFGSKESQNKARRALAEAQALARRETGFSLQPRGTSSLFDLKCDTASSQDKQGIADEVFKASSVVRRDLSNSNDLY